MESSIKKDIILNGTDSIAVYKENGLVYRAKELESYTQIVFRNIKANVTQYFDLKSVISKEYRVMDMLVDVKPDDDFRTINEGDATNMGYAYPYVTIIRDNKRILIQQLSPQGGGFDAKFVFILPGDIISFLITQNLNSIIFCCQSVYLEKTIIVPEVITDVPSNTEN